MSAETLTILLSIAALALTCLIPAIGGLVAWVWQLWQKHHQLDSRVQGGHYSKPEIDQIIERLERAVSERLRLELRPVKWQLAQIMRRWEVPPDIPPDDEIEPG